MPIKEAFCYSLPIKSRVILYIVYMCLVSDLYVLIVDILNLTHSCRMYDDIPRGEEVLKHQKAKLVNN
jgi:hypothetical protein